MSEQPAAVPRASVLRTFKAVAWSFFGVRKDSELPLDMAQLNPFHVIAVGLICCLALVVGLMVLVHWVVAK